MRTKVQPYASVRDAEGEQRGAAEKKIDRSAPRSRSRGSLQLQGGYGRVVPRGASSVRSTREIKVELRVNRARLTTALTSAKRMGAGRRGRLYRPDGAYRGVNAREGILFRTLIASITNSA